MTFTPGASACDGGRQAPTLGRAQVLAVAVEVGVEDGLSAVTMERLAKELGVTPELIGQHFSSEAQLTIDAFHAAATVELEGARARTAAALSPLDALTALMDYNIDSEESVVWMDAWSLSRRFPLLATEVREMNRQWLELIATLVQAGRDAGQIHVDDTEVTARRILTLIDGLDSQKLCRDVPQQELRDIAHAYVNSLRHSLFEQAKLAAIGTLTAGVAHEMKNPLNFVVNFTELNLELCHELREDMPTDGDDAFSDVEGNLHLVLHHAHRALAVMDTMLEVGRPRTNDDARPCRVNQIVEQSTGLADHAWRITRSDTRCAVHVDLDDGDPTVLGLEGDLVQVVINLVLNALEAASSVSHRQGAVRVSVRHDDQSVFVEVSDNGPGIAAQALPRIFEPFFTTKLGSGGTGLGLSICKDIIDNRHNGELMVTSVPGEGARFRARLPLCHSGGSKAS